MPFVSTTEYLHRKLKVIGFEVYFRLNGHKRYTHSLQ